MAEDMKPCSRRAKRTTHYAVYMVAAMLSVVTPADATEPPGSAAPSELARVKYDLAARAYQSRRFGDAVLLLEESLRLHRSPNARLLLGHCYRDLGRLGTAYTTYRAAEREAAERLRAGQRQYDEARKSALAEMADLEPRVPNLTVAIPANIPADFSVKLDGLPFAREQWGTVVPLDPGKHELTASGTKLRTLTRAIELRVGQRLRVDLSPEREASAEVRLLLPEAASPKGTVLLVDGQASPLGGEATSLYLDPGAHVITLSAPGRRTFRWQRQLENGELVNLRPSLPRASPRWAALAMGGLTVATLATAIGLGAQAQSEDDANRPLANSVAVQPLDKIAARDHILTLAHAATGLFAVSGALGAATLALALTADWRGEQARPKPRVAAFGIAGGAGLLTWGEF